MPRGKAKKTDVPSQSLLSKIAGVSLEKLEEALHWRKNQKKNIEEKKKERSKLKADISATQKALDKLQKEIDLLQGKKPRKGTKKGGAKTLAASFFSGKDAGTIITVPDLVGAGLSYQTANNKVKAMVKDGSLVEAGKDGRTKKYKLKKAIA